jgi:hypothetical protein
VEKARFSEKMCADRAHPRETVAGRIDVIGRGDVASACQKLRKFDSRNSGGLPAMRAALMAPADDPVTQLSGIARMCNRSKAPPWYAPRPRPPDKTRHVSGLSGIMTCSPKLMHKTKSKGLRSFILERRYWMPTF